MGRFTDTYTLVRFGNRRHPWVLRLLVATVGWGAVLVSGGGVNASRTCFRHLRDGHAFKASLRRLAWYLKTGILRVQLIDDPNFDITEGLETPDELRTLGSYLQKRRNTNPDDLSLWIDQLYLDATLLHHHARSDRFAPGAFERFCAQADALLQRIGTPPPLSDRTHIRSDTSPPPPFTSDTFIPSATRSLQLFSEHLPNTDYPWYVISGTFLGLHRDNGFLPHDYDIDLGINAHEVDMDDLVSRLRSLPEHTIKSIYTIPRISVGETVTYHEQTGIIKLVHSSGIQIDLFVHHLREGKLLHGTRIHVWENTAYGLEHRTLAGVDVLAPDTPERYLRENYGDWETPITEFNCSTDTPNMHITQNFYAIAFFLRKLFTHHRSGEIAAWQSTWQTLQHEGVIIDQRIDPAFFARPL